MHEEADNENEDYGVNEKTSRSYRAVIDSFQIEKPSSLVRKLENKGVGENEEDNADDDSDEQFVETGDAHSFLIAAFFDNKNVRFSGTTHFCFLLLKILNTEKV